MAGGRAFEDAEIRIIAESKIEGLGSDQIHERLEAAGYNRSRGSVAKHMSHPRVKEHIQRVMAQNPDLPPVVTRKLTPDAVAEHQDPAKLWERAKQVTSAQITYQRDRHEAEIGFLTNKPIALVFASDQHITQSGPVNLEQMEADAKLVADTPGMYAILGGDGVDNHIKHRAALVNSGSVPGREWVLYDHYLGMFGSRLAAMVSGNHDDWTHDFAGIDMVQRIAERRRIFYAPDYVVLNVRLKTDPDEEGTTYRVKIRHQYRYGSSFNQTHSLKRMWEMDDHDFDIGVLCHLHEAAMEPFKKHGKWRWAFRSGSYQHTSGHSRRYGYGWGQPSCPTAIIWPGQMRMLGFLDVRDAAGYLTYLRAQPTS